MIFKHMILYNNLDNSSIWTFRNFLIDTQYCLTYVARARFLRIELKAILSTLVKRSLKSEEVSRREVWSINISHVDSSTKKRVQKVWIFELLRALGKWVPHIFPGGLRPAGKLSGRASDVSMSIHVVWADALLFKTRNAVSRCTRCAEFMVFDGLCHVQEVCP